MAEKVVWTNPGLSDLWSGSWAWQSQFQDPRLYLASDQRKPPREQVPLGDWHQVVHPDLPMALSPKDWPPAAIEDGARRFESPTLSFEWPQDVVVTYWLLYNHAIFPPRLVATCRLFDPARTVAAGDPLSFKLTFDLSDHGPPCPE